MVRHWSMDACIDATMDAAHSLALRLAELHSVRAEPREGAEPVRGPHGARLERTEWSSARRNARECMPPIVAPGDAHTPARTPNNPRVCVFVTNKLQH